MLTPAPPKNDRPALAYGFDHIDDVPTAEDWDAYYEELETEADFTPDYMEEMEVVDGVGPDDDPQLVNSESVDDPVEGAESDEPLPSTSAEVALILPSNLAAPIDASPATPPPSLSVDEDPPISGDATPTRDERPEPETPSSTRRRVIPRSPSRSPPKRRRHEEGYGRKQKGRKYK